MSRLSRCEKPYDTREKGEQMPSRAPRMCQQCRRLFTDRRCPHCTRPWGSSKRGGSTSRWRRLRLHVFDEQDGMCAIDGCFKLCDELDHIVPVHEGGTDERDNVQALCKPHHDEKTMREAAAARAQARPYAG